jgi:D-serine deaminase-like pyridoxal phosphate-dependent protein
MVGTKVQEIETPALLLDLDAMESNLALMAEVCRRSNKRLRPHFKNHRAPALARRQIASGAAGFTCSRLREVEILVEHGFSSILVANEIVSAGKLYALLELSRRADIVLAIDSPLQVAELGRLGRKRGCPPSVVIDLDLGLHRCGVSCADEAIELAEAAAAEGLRIRGFMGYEGNLQLLEPGQEKEQAVAGAYGPLVAAVNAFRQCGAPPEMVSTAGTGTYSMAASTPEITEVQPGTYVVMDTAYTAAAPEFRLTLSLLATVISRTRGERLVMDAGIKALSGERGLPWLKDAGKRLNALHAEHALVDLHDNGFDCRVGDKVEIWVHYSDGTINLHDRMYGIRNGRVEEVIAIEH